MSDFPRPHSLTDSDRNGSVIIVATLLMAWMLLTFMIRLYTRIATTSPLGLDDLFAGIGSVLGTIQVIVILEGFKQGLGKSEDLLSYSQGLHAAKLKDYWVSDILFLLANSAAKVSVAFLILRNSCEQGYRRVCHSLLAFIAIWTLGSAIAVGLECNFHYPPPWVGRCADVGVRWQVVTAFDALIEAGLFLMSTYLIWDQMCLSSKAVVVLPFGSRIAVIIISIIRMAYLTKALQTSDFYLHGVGTVICTQILMHYSLIASTIPCLKPFVISFNTGSQQGSTDHKMFSVGGCASSTQSTMTRSQSGQELSSSAPPSPFFLRSSSPFSLRPSSPFSLRPSPPFFLRPKKVRPRSSLSPPRAIITREEGNEECGYGATTLDDVMSIAGTEADNEPVFNGSSERFYSLNSNSSRRLILMHQRSLQLEKLRKQAEAGAEEDGVNMTDAESPREQQSQHRSLQRRGVSIEMISVKTEKLKRLFSI